MKITHKTLRELLNMLNSRNIQGQFDLMTDITGHRLAHMAPGSDVYRPINTGRLSTREMYFFMAGMLTTLSDDNPY